MSVVAREPDFEAMVRQVLAPWPHLEREGMTLRLLGSGVGAKADLSAGQEFLSRVAPYGWGVLSWPVEYGGPSLTKDEKSYLLEELADRAVPDLYPFDVALRLCGPAIIEYGSPDQRRKWLDAIRTGEVWCELFSEPDAGSDLASLRTRADRVDDGWVVSGQKIWSSRAHYARWGLLLARSDQEASKHAGLTVFVMDMQADGVSTVPVRQINGDSSFNAVFMDSVFVPDDHRIGDPGHGWKIAMRTLTRERSSHDRYTGQLDVSDAIGVWRERAAGHGPVFRDRLVQAIIELTVLQLTTARAQVGAERGHVGPEGSGEKLRRSLAYKALANLALDGQGAAGMLADSDRATVFLTSPSLSIRGGTDEIQKSLLAERVLGLYRDR